MIFITLGTQDMPFIRLLEQFQSYYIEHQLTEPVLVQSGFTPFKSELFTVVDYLDKDAFETTMNEAGLVITHGGAGSIFGALHHHKKIIAMPRLAQYHEHNDDHQIELIEQLSSMGHILYVKEDFNEIKDVWEAFVPIPYQTQNTIITLIDAFIQGETK